MLTLKNPNGLAKAVVVLLAGNIFFDVLLGLVDVRNLIGGAWGYAEPPTFAGADVYVLYSMSFTLFFATGVVFIIWFHRLRKNAEIWARDLQTRTPGYAIGCWFIPLGNFWIPRSIAVEIWRASRWEPYAADGKRELTLLNSWWVCWIIGTLVNWISGKMYGAAETAEAYVIATQWSLVGYVLDAVAAVLAILVVRRLTSMQTAKATGMIPAAQ
ncbi:DUF4328 domain-containing protein [Streptomyces vietnamensis]|uniref:DUF4328 domain-containing protein n=1 Tax=Streptomyces vietnamensis TaxID=362257 RepID=UPI00342B9B57